MEKKIAKMAYDETEYGPESELVFEPTMAQQQYKEECDINNIMRKYGATGVIDHINALQGEYGDFSNVKDYHSAHNAVMAANESFMNLPAQIRKEFDNDPVKLMEFLQNEGNRKKAEELGLVVPKEQSSTELSAQAPQAQQQPQAQQNANK